MVANEVKSAPELPSYFSREFFENVKGNSNSKVVDFSAIPAVGKGENYTSSMYRVRVHNSDDVTRSIIVKCCPEEGRMKEILEGFGIFDKEILALSKLVPDVIGLLKKSGRDTQLGPELLYSQKDPSCIILEDLSVSGYKLADRKTGLDEQHCRIVLSKLAKLHAAGKLVYERDSSDLESFQSSIFKCDQMEISSDFYKKCVEGVNEQMQTWGEEYQHIIDKLEILKNNYATRAPVVARDDCAFKVVNHGDLWVNNIMFKYDENDKVQDAIMVDFQNCFYGSPACDLNYFIYSSLSEDTFWNSRDALVEYYHEALTKELRALNYTGYIPTLDELRKEMDICSFISIHSIAVIKPLLLNQAEENDDITDEINGSETGNQAMRRKCSNPPLVKILKTRFRYMDEQGILDANL